MAAFARCPSCCKHTRNQLFELGSNRCAYLKLLLHFAALTAAKHCSAVPVAHSSALNVNITCAGSHNDSRTVACSGHRLHPLPAASRHGDSLCSGVSYCGGTGAWKRWTAQLRQHGVGMLRWPSGCTAPRAPRLLLQPAPQRRSRCRSNRGVAPRCNGNRAAACPAQVLQPHTRVHELARMTP